MKKMISASALGMAVLFSMITGGCKKEDNNLAPELTVSDAVIGMTGQTVSLSASASDPDGDALTYTWKIIESPNGSMPVLSNSSNNNASFVTPTAGFYRIEVVVEDSRGGQASGVISLSIGGVLPSNFTSVTTLPDLFADASVPDYYATSTVQIREGLTLSPGVVLECGSDVLLWVNGNAGFFRAEGTAANKVIIRGMNKAKGSWRGIAITSTNVNNSLNYVDIFHAGSSNNGARRAAIRVQSNAGARLAIANTHISDTDGHGLFVDGSDGVLTNFASNTFSNNNLAPIRLAADQVSSLDKQSVYSGNTIQAIEVAAAGNATVRFSENSTVPALTIPYHFHSVTELMASVTFEPGVTCLFNSGLRLSVNAAGAIIANGTSGQPITFAGISEVAGSWSGIEISSPSSSNLLNHAIVSHGGSSAGRGANIYMFGSQSAFLTLTNSTVSHSQTYGVRTSAGTTTLNESDNTFLANASGDIRRD